MEKRRVLTVLRSGGEFLPEHVQALQRQVAKHAPTATFQCLTDLTIPGIDCIQLKQTWPGWWAKLEMFREDIGGDFLFTDLDNVVLGPLDDLFVGKYTTQRGDWNALAYIPEGGFPHLYEEFKHAPGLHIMHNAPNGIEGKAFGDAGFIARRMQGQYWEDILPGQVLNICKVHTRAPWPFKRSRLPIPPETRVLLCSTMYGRPWQLPEFRELYG